MQEHNLIFGILSLLFVMSLVLFANLCVKLEKKKKKKKQPNSERHAQNRKPSTTESMQKLQSIATIESTTGSHERSVPHRHLSTNSSHYSDKRLRPFPSYTAMDKSSHSHSRSTSSVSPRSVNSLDLRPELDRFRIGSESQKLRKDTTIVTGHQRQRSMEVQRSFIYPPSFNYPPARPSPLPKRPSHLFHEQLKRTEPMSQFNRENSLRSSSSSTVISQKRSHYQPRSPCSSVTTGILPMDSNTPNSPSIDGSPSEANKYKVAAVSNPIVPKYSDSKAKGTPVRHRPDANESSVTESSSPYREYNNIPPITSYHEQTPSHIEISLTSASDIPEAISIPKQPYMHPKPRLVKRQLSHEDSNYYPPYYQPTTDSTCQLYSTQSNKSLPLRMRFPKLSNGTDFADDDTEGTSVCPSLYSSYTSLYQTDTEEFMIGDPQAIKLARDLEATYAPTTELRTPLVAQYAKHYTENLLRTARRPSNMSDLSDSDVSFIWQGGDSGKHEYSPHDLSVSTDKRGVLLPRPGYRKPGYTDYTGGLSFFSFVRKDSIPEETHTTGMGSNRRAATSPSRFMNYPLYTQSPRYIPPESPHFTYPSIDSASGTYTQSHTPVHSSSMSQSNECIKTPQKQSLVNSNSRSHPNLRSHKHSHSKSSVGSRLDHPSPYHPSADTHINRNNSNNELSSSGISLTHL